LNEVATFLLAHERYIIIEI